MRDLQRHVEDPALRWLDQPRREGSHQARMPRTDMSARKSLRASLPRVEEKAQVEFIVKIKPKIAYVQRGIRVGRVNDWKLMDFIPAPVPPHARMRPLIGIVVDSNGAISERPMTSLRWLRLGASCNVYAGAVPLESCEFAVQTSTAGQHN